MVETLLFRVQRFRVSRSGDEIGFQFSRGCSTLQNVPSANCFQFIGRNQLTGLRRVFSLVAGSVREIETNH